MNKSISRRDFLSRGLSRGLQLPIAGGVLLGLSACGDSSDATALLCADPKTMTSAQESVRRTLNYAEISPDPATVCAGCAFFKASSEASGCGRCEMFAGEPVNPGGHCDSWSADA